MYRLRRREISRRLKQALVLRAKWNRMYKVHDNVNVKTGLKDDEV